MQAIFVRFLLSNFALAFFLLAILLIKRICRNQLGPSNTHMISRFSLILLILPLVPHDGAVGSGMLLDLWKQLRSPNIAGNAGTVSGGSVVQVNDWMQDYAVSAMQSQTLPLYLFFVWLAGMVVLLILTIRSVYQVCILRKTIIAVNSPDLLGCFSDCKELAMYSADVRLGYSPDIASPMAAGWLRPMIVLPLTRRRIPSGEMQGVFLHELYHLKHRDALEGTIACLLRALYWFNPAVWLFLRELRTEAEIHCDADVIETIGKERGAEYGRTVLSFVLKKENPIWASAQMGSGKQRIKQRIFSIANYQEQTPRAKRKGMLAALLIGLVIVATLPSLSVFAADRVELPANTATEDFSAYFGDFEGGLVLYNSADSAFTVYNERESTKRISPASTSKIYSLLFALDAGVVEAEDSLRLWDVTPYEFESWCRNHDLYSAMKDSVNWYYQRLDEEIGLPRMRQSFAKIGYGNMDLSGGIQEYWQGGSLKISPLEQVSLLHKLYEGGLGFSPETVQTVRDAILLEQGDGVKLSGKTGTLDYGEYLEGCFVGCVETPENSWYFAISVRGDDASGSEAAKIVLAILEEKGICESTLTL